MTKLIRKLSMLMMVIMLSFSLSGSAVAAAAMADIEVYFPRLLYYVDGEEVAPPATHQGFIYEKRTYVPLRFVAYSLQHAVDWDQSQMKVTVRAPNEVEQIEIKEYILNHTVRDTAHHAGRVNVPPTKIRAYQGTIQYDFYGEMHTPPEGMTGFIYQQTIYVPVSFFAMKLGVDVTWKGEEYSITLNSKAAAEDDPADETDEGTKEPANDAGGQPGSSGSGGGSAPNKPSKSSIEEKYIAQARKLETSCTSDLMDLAASYLLSKDETAKQSLKEQGKARVSACDTSFNAIIVQLSAELVKHGYSTEIVEEMRTEYEAKKEFGKSLLD